VNIVTKILIVFCAVMSLILSAITMAYAANANAIRSSFREEQSRRVQAEANLSNQVQLAGAQKTTDADRIRTAEDAVNALKRDLANLQAERTDLMARAEAAQADAQSIRNQISQLGATVDTQTAMIKSYRDESTALRDQLFRASQKEIELVDRVNDLDSAREVLEQNARALKEQLEETRLSLQSAQQGGSASSASGQTTRQGRELPGPVVRARITETFKSPSGETMVVIDEGANRGLRADGLLNITRGDTFVGSLLIVTVEPNRAVGKLTLAAGNMTPANGDTVLSRLD
jgi:prefoldin subunit 5